eukprot:574941-Hanusia_phi.AAC.1
MRLVSGIVEDPRLLTCPPPQQPAAPLQGPALSHRPAVAARMSPASAGVSTRSARLHSSSPAPGVRSTEQNHSQLGGADQAHLLFKIASSPLLSSYLSPLATRAQAPTRTRT